jgi:hypothetical protein
MERYFVLVLVGVTSVAAYLAGTAVLGCSPARVRHAFGKMLECIGIAIVFFAVNVAVGVAITLASRTIFHRFMSMYLSNDISLLVLSLLQGLLFLFWHDSAGEGQMRGVR